MRGAKVLASVALATSVVFACGSHETKTNEPSGVATATAQSSLSAPLETEAWLPLVVPPFRGTTTMVFDALRGEGVLFGGSNTGDRESTWIWNGHQFREHQARRGIAEPLARTGHALAWDPVHQVVVLFGGALRSGVTAGDTWSWNGRTWNEVATEPHPAPRSNAALVWDDERKNLVLYGGQGLEGVLTDTWTFDGTRWSLAYTNSPSQRTDAAIAWDPERKNIVLVGGYFREPLGDTWFWSGKDWRPFNGLGPIPRSFAKLAWDKSAKNLVLFGGSGKTAAIADTATFDGKKWSTLTGKQPSPRVEMAMAWDDSRGYMLLHGGQNDLGTFLSDTWIYKDGTWTEVPGTSKDPIPPTTGASMLWDERRKELFMFGGQSFTTYGNGWTWNGTNWVRAFGAELPVQRWQSATTYDAERGTTVLFGGVGRNDYLGDTWLWNGRAWNQPNLGSSNRPPPRAQAAMGWDRARKEVVLFGGQSSSGFLADTWVWNGALWIPKIGTPTPAARTAAIMGFDPKTERLMLVGGQNGFSMPGDAWSWDGTTWKSEPTEAPITSAKVMAVDEERKTLVLVAINATWTFDGTSWRRMTSGVPTGMADATLTWDPIRKNLVLIGGTNTVLTEVWTWDGATWTRRAAGATNVPPRRTDHKAVWDPIRRAVVMYGGNFGSLDDTWAFDGSGWTLVAPSKDPLDPYPIGTSQYAYVRQGSSAYTSLLSAQSDPATPAAWTFHTRGRACTAGDQCHSNFCVDGVCCEQAACGSCETCAAPNDSGRCTAITRTEDPDTCPAADGRTCDSEGRCTRANGAKCTVASECLSGYCVQPFPGLPNVGPNQGICCNRACDGVCEACAAGLKLSQRDDGTCEAANAGTNPNLRCKGTLSCNSKGVCGPESKSYCKDVFTLVDESGMERTCGRYRCEKGACLSRCTNDAQCGLARTCSVDGYCDLLADSGCSTSPASAGRAPASFGWAYVAAILGILARVRAKRHGRARGAQF